MSSDSHITYIAADSGVDARHDNERTGNRPAFNQLMVSDSYTTDTSARPRNIARDLLDVLGDTLSILLANSRPLDEDEAGLDCHGHIICLACPREWNDPPFLAFSMLSHIRLHLRRQPGHPLVMYCRDPHDGKHHSVANLLRANGIDVPRTTWGGARPGAGAPKGNLNALRNGSRSQDTAIREYMADLDVQNRLSAVIFLRQYKKGD